MYYALETSHLECGGTSGLILPIENNKDDELSHFYDFVMLCKTPSQQSTIEPESSNLKK